MISADWSELKLMYDFKTAQCGFQFRSFSFSLNFIFRVWRIQNVHGMDKLPKRLQIRLRIVSVFIVKRDLLFLHVYFLRDSSGHHNCIIHVCVKDNTSTSTIKDNTSRIILW